jgi:hypothetical protein
MSVTLAAPLAMRTPKWSTSTLPDSISRHGNGRADTSRGAYTRTQPSGNASLDALLPGGGWPLGSLVEILVDRAGEAELGLVLPALAAFTRSGRRVAMIAPPFAPDTLALTAAGVDLKRIIQIDSSQAELHWSAEQSLRAGCCASVLHWLPEHDYRKLRRLQLAAEAGGSLAFVFSAAEAVMQPSPAALRLRLLHSLGGPRIEVIKCRGIIDQHQLRRVSLPTGDAQANETVHPFHTSKGFGGSLPARHNVSVQ